MQTPDFLPDVEAEIRFLSTNEGGRSEPVRSGYRPQIYYGGHDWVVVQEYPDTEWVFPGETVFARLWFLSPDEHDGNVVEGMSFEVREGRRIVAVGQITKIVNLSASASNSRRRKAD